MADEEPAADIQCLQPYSWWDHVSHHYDPLQKRWSFLDGCVACETKEHRYVITSPNMDFIPTPSFGMRDVALGPDGHFGSADPILWPQTLTLGTRYPWLVAIQRKPSSPDHLRCLLWRVLRHADFCPSSTSVMYSFGTLAPGVYGKCVSLFEEARILVEAFEGAYGHPQQLRWLYTTIRNTLERLRMPSTLRDAVRQYACFQRYTLYIHAWFQWYVVIHKKFPMSNPPIQALKKDEMMGCITTAPVIAQELYLAGIPVWIARFPEQIMSTDVIQNLTPLIPPTRHLTFCDDKELLLMKDELQDRCSARLLCGDSQIDWINQQALGYLDIERIIHSGDSRDMAQSKPKSPPHAIPSPTPRDEQSSAQGAAGLSSHIGTLSCQEDATPKQRDVQLGSSSTCSAGPSTAESSRQSISSTFPMSKACERRDEQLKYSNACVHIQGSAKSTASTQKATSSTPAINKASKPRRNQGARFQPYTKCTTNVPHLLPNEAKKFDPPKTREEKLPDAAPPWEEALADILRNNPKPLAAIWRYWLPQPHVVVGSQVPDRRRRYALNWLRLRPHWLSVLARLETAPFEAIRGAGSHAGPFKASQWREYLSISAQHTEKQLSSSANAKRSQERREVAAAFKELLECEVLPSDQPAMWYCQDIQHIGLDTRQEYAVYQQIAWDLFNLGFYFELLELDRHLVPQLGGQDQVEENEHRELIAAIFPSSHHLSSTCFPSSDLGITAHKMWARAKYLEAFRQVLRRWPDVPAEVRNCVPLPSIPSSTLFHTVERKMTGFYCQKFFDVAGRAPTVPHMVPLPETHDQVACARK
ncbi:hypothetical protein NM688_g1737 [Phlebia brevispora]|uniref:Uncharacterized protein n=1 Tax=Phlebia brevispora TaxID=194682 RepID=A0ACC1TAG3_9APHY|nr:hypothetical protein NM688_g1737 [Phlebia brevispora]